MAPKAHTEHEDFTCADCGSKDGTHWRPVAAPGWGNHGWGWLCDECDLGACDECGEEFPMSTMVLWDAEGDLKFINQPWAVGDTCYCQGCNDNRQRDAD